jgi:hypothetical protein
VLLPLGAVPGLAGHAPSGAGGSPVSETSPSELVGAGSLVSTGGALLSGAVDVTGGGVVSVVDGVTEGPGGVTGTGPDGEGGGTGVTVDVDGLLLGVTGGTTGTGVVGVTLGVVVEVVGAMLGLPGSVSPQPAAKNSAKHEATRVPRRARDGEDTEAETTDDKRMSRF